MKRAAAAVGMCLGLVPVSAGAVDWSLKGSASETVELNDNLFLRSMLQGGTLGSYSTMTSSAEARTPTSKFDFDSDVNYRKYWGGLDSNQQNENLSYGFKGRYENLGKTSSDREFIEASFNQRSSAFALRQELGLLSNVTGALDTLNVSGGIDRALSAQDTLNFFARSTRTSYEPSGAGTAFQDTSGSTTWQHRLSSTLSVNTVSEVEWLVYDNATGTNVEILRNQAGIDAALTQLLSFRGSAGAAYVLTQHGAGTLTSFGGGTSGTTSQSGAQVGFVTNMALTYKMLKDTTLTLNGIQTIAPSVVGNLYTTTTISAGLSHIINSHSSLSLSADVNRQSSTTITQFVSTGLSYSYQLAREWTAQFSYRHLHRFASSNGAPIINPISGLPLASGPGPADSNSVTFVLTKQFTLLAHTD